MVDSGAAYFSYWEDGAAIYEEDVCAYETPTHLEHGYDGNLCISPSQAD